MFVEILAPEINLLVTRVDHTDALITQLVGHSLDKGSLFPGERETDIVVVRGRLVHGDSLRLWLWLVRAAVRGQTWAQHGGCISDQEGSMEVRQEDVETDSSQTQPAA